MRICSGAGCLRAVPDDVRFCDECKPAPKPAEDIREHQRTDAYNAELDALRKTARWQRTRERALKACPMCARCSVELSVIADHIVPAQIVVQQARDSGLYRDRSAGYFFLSNIQGLCRACHYAKTLEDKAHVGPWPDAVAKEMAQPKRKWF